MRPLMPQCSIARPVVVAVATLLFVSCGGSENVDPGPTVVVQQPQDQTVGVGSTATFRVQFGGSPPLSVQWRKGSEAIPSANDVTYTTPPSVATDDGLTFSVQFETVGRNRPILVPSQSARLSVTPPLPSGPGTYTAGGPMVMNRAQHVAVRLPGGSVLIAGGTPVAAAPIPEKSLSAELYDPVSNTFAATGSMSSARRAGHAAVLLPNGTVLICGGDDANGLLPLATAEIFDPATGRFTATGSMQFARTKHAAVLLPNGKVLVAGGASSENIYHAEIYDPVSGLFGPTSPMSRIRNITQGAPLPDGALIVGGQGPERFIAASSTFVPVSTPDAMGYLDNMTTSPLTDGRVAVVGGYDMNKGGNPAALGAAYVFDPATEVFASSGSLTWPRASATSTALKNGRLLVFGGSSSARNPERAEVLDPAAGTFVPTVALESGRTGHTATQLSDGRVLIAGGWAARSNADNPSPAPPLLFVP